MDAGTICSAEACRNTIAFAPMRTCWSLFEILLHCSSVITSRIKSLKLQAKVNHTFYLCSCAGVLMQATYTLHNSLCPVQIANSDARGHDDLTRSQATCKSLTTGSNFHTVVPRGLSRLPGSVMSSLEPPPPYNVR